MTARHAAILARLADIGERLAMKHAERALSADDPDVEAKATAAFHRAARSVRQCLALEAKLVRDAARATREDHARAEGEATARGIRRKAHARAAVERLIWTECEDQIEAGTARGRAQRPPGPAKNSPRGFEDAAPEVLIARLGPATSAWPSPASARAPTRAAAGPRRSAWPSLRRPNGAPRPDAGSTPDHPGRSLRVLLPLREEVACEAGRMWGLSEPSPSPDRPFRADGGARPHIRRPSAATFSHKGRNSA